MVDETLLLTAAESATEAAGSSLARSLHRIPVTIGLSGALGTGKTAFMRGFLRELGVTDPVTSPTYALEQRYGTPLGEALHIDLYRLTEPEAREALRGIEEFDGIRCVEWPDRAGDALRTDIDVRIRETDRNARTIAIECLDVDWPDDDTVDAWRMELRLPANVGAHCDAVAEFCSRAADALVERGVFVRKHFLRAAGKTHDLLRFVDFRPGASPPGWEPTPEQLAAWEPWKRRAPGATHEEAVRVFLRERGFDALADLVHSHSVHLPMDARDTTEARVLYYADKRVIGDRFVTIAERYADFAERYGNGKRSPESLQWEQDALETERLLFPEGAPF